MTSLKAPAAAPSYLTSIPHRSAQIEETWAYLYDGLEHIMLKGQQDLSFAAYTNMYTTVYNCCTTIKMVSSGHKGTRRAPRVTRTTFDFHDSGKESRRLRSVLQTKHLFYGAFQADDKGLTFIDVSRKFSRAFHRLVKRFKILTFYATMLNSGTGIQLGPNF